MGVVYEGMKVYTSQPKPRNVTPDAEGHCTWLRDYGDPLKRPVYTTRSFDEFKIWYGENVASRSA